MTSNGVAIGMTLCSILNMFYMHCAARDYSMATMECSMGEANDLLVKQTLGKVCPLV